MGQLFESANNKRSFYSLRGSHHPREEIDNWKQMVGNYKRNAGAYREQCEKQVQHDVQDNER